MDYVTRKSCNTKTQEASIVELPANKLGMVLVKSKARNNNFHIKDLYLQWDRIMGTANTGTYINTLLISLLMVYKKTPKIDYIDQAQKESVVPNQDTLFIAIAVKYK